MPEELKQSFVERELASTGTQYRLTFLFLCCKLISATSLQLYEFYRQKGVLVYAVAGT